MNMQVTVGPINNEHASDSRANNEHVSDSRANNEHVTGALLKANKYEQC